MSESAKHKHHRFPYMQNRELSWLEFNKRVLDQSTDDMVPLLDQLNFISIFWSNLKEFFMVRVGSLADLALVKKSIVDKKSGMTSAEQLDAIYKRCHELYPYYAQCYQSVSRKLASEGIRNLRKSDLSIEQTEFVTDYFYDNIMPFLSPQIVNSRHPFPHLENGSLYIVVRLDEHARNSGKKKKGDKVASNQGAEGVTLGLIPLPRQCERMVIVPESGTYSWDTYSRSAKAYEGCEFMLLEHVIEMFCEEIFSMYKVKHTNIICVTRNADLDATEGAEEQGEDYREHMKRILQKRARLSPVRLESERELSSTVKRVLLERLGLKEQQLFVLPIPLDLGYAGDISDCIGDALKASLSMTPFMPQWPASIDRNRPIMDQISEHEALISYPYETMDVFVRMLREAAVDPNVISIKITLYRLASQSHLAEALIAAAEAGKEVTAIFELRARFDESNNIEWSQRFERAGCHVLYGFREYKVHSKICCITRQTPYGLQHITQLGTGNYNERTARLYTDFCFITADPNIGRDAMLYFRNMALENTSDEYDILWVSPLQIKQNILAGIDEQIARQRCGMDSGLFFKTNSITDKDIINKIVEASQAGVRCTLLVRGISCIVPGVEGYTENVCVVSIVGRLLEHSRIYCFGPLDGNVKIYLSSADLMTRNMDKRIEIAWPIYNASLKNEIIGYIGTCMADTAKLRDLLPNKEYTPLRYFAQKDSATGEIELMDSQEYLIAEAQRKHLAAAAIAASLEANRVLDVKDSEAFAANEQVAEAPAAAYGGNPAPGPAADPGISSAAVPVAEPLQADAAAFAPDPYQSQVQPVPTMPFEPEPPEPLGPELAFVPMPGPMFAQEPDPMHMPMAGIVHTQAIAPEAAAMSDAAFAPVPEPVPEPMPEAAFVSEPLAQPVSEAAFVAPAAEPALQPQPQAQAQSQHPMQTAQPQQPTQPQAQPETTQAAQPQSHAQPQQAAQPAEPQFQQSRQLEQQPQPKPQPQPQQPQEEDILGRFKMKEPRPFSREEEKHLSGIPHLYEISAVVGGAGAAGAQSSEDGEFSKADTLDLDEQRRKEEGEGDGSRQSERRRKAFNPEDDVPAYDSIESFFNKTPESNKFVIPSKKDVFGRPEY